MHKPSIAQLVYNVLFPKPRQNDPSSFAAHAARNLVAEIRIETANYYGPLDCLEAQYPGLDYAFPPHRKRLCRFHHHRRLFRAFDELRLTGTEIAQLCQWEGTRFARERYERNEGITIRDTTLDTIRVAPPHTPPSVRFYSATNASRAAPNQPQFLGGYDGAGIDTDEEGSDDGIESYGTRLNESLRRLTAAREQGIDMTNEDLELFEQWLKETIERGGHADVLEAIREGRPIDFSYNDPSALSRVPQPPTMAASSQMPVNPGTIGQVATQMSGAALGPGDVAMTALPESQIGSPHNPTRRTAG